MKKERLAEHGYRAGRRSLSRGGPIDRKGCLVFAVACLWVIGMGTVLAAADTSMGRALGVTLVSGIALLAFWVPGRMRSRIE